MILFFLLWKNHSFSGLSGSLKPQRVPAYLRLLGDPFVCPATFPVCMQSWAASRMIVLIKTSFFPRLAELEALHGWGLERRGQWGKCGTDLIVPSPPPPAGCPLPVTHMLVQVLWAILVKYWCEEGSKKQLAGFYHLTTFKQQYLYKKASLEFSSK